MDDHGIVYQNLKLHETMPVVDIALIDPLLV